MSKSMFFWFVIFSVSTLFLVGLCSTLAMADALAGPTSDVRLKNETIAITIDSHTGGLRTVTDRQLNKTYHIDDPGFLLELGEGKKEGSLARITPTDCTVKETNLAKDFVSVVFEARKAPAKIIVTYRLGPKDPFAEKLVRVDYLGKGDYNISRIDMFDWKMATKPTKSIPYYGYLYSDRSRVFQDQGVRAPSDNSIAYFFRYGDAGLFTMVSCDFVLMHQDKKSGRYRSTYWPGQILSAKERFTSEKGFIGVYRRKGRFHLPYKSNKYLKDFLTPNVDAALDRAEIEAVQTAVQKYLKPEVYMFLANGWALDLPYQLNSPEAAKKFKAAIDNIRRFPQMEALHFIDNFCGLSGEFAEYGLKMPIKPNRYAEEVFQYAKKQGIGLSMFIWTTRPQRDQSAEKHQELLKLDDKKKRMLDSYALSRQYTDFIFDTVSTLVKKYPQIQGLTYDFMYIYPDYDPDHGYLPGHGSLYAQWANIRDANRRIRREFPNLMLRYQIGWRSLGPWLAEHASFVHNAHDPNVENQRNFLDFHVGYQFANNYRLGSWFANNNKMFPRYMMNAFLVHKAHSFDAWDYGAWEYCIMSRIACGCGFGMLTAFPDKANGEVLPKEHAEFLDKWITWQRNHKDYYTRESELFGEPSPTNVDGYAYGNGKDSIVFVCNPTFETKTVVIPIDETIHLPRNKQRWTVKELYPEARYRVGPDDGVFNYGSRFVTRIPPQTVTLFEVKPDSPDEPLLLGAEGNIAVKSRKLVLYNLRGPTGIKRLVAIRLPQGQAASPPLIYHEKTIPTTRSKNLLLAAVRFDGQPIRPEVSDWRATREGKRLKIHATIDVPLEAKKVLEHQHQTMPVSRKYNTPKWLDRTAWLDSGRFIIHLPIVPPGIDPDPIRAPTPQKAIHKVKGFNITARLNGQPIKVHPNIMGLDKKSRWSGSFIDASKAIRYGQENELVLDLPPMPKQNVFGIYLSNLTPQYTDQFTILDPPSRVTSIDIPDATEAYPPIPKIITDGDRIKAWLELRISGHKSPLSRKAISVHDGRATEVRFMDTDPRWTIDEKGGKKSGSAPQRILIAIEGTASTQVRLGTDSASSCKFTLGEALRAWQARSDPFDPFALKLPWPTQKATVRIDLLEPPKEKQMIQEDL